MPVRGDKLHVAVLMAAIAGMGKLDLIGLCWCDVNFDKNLVYWYDTKNGEPRIPPVYF